MTTYTFPTTNTQIRTVMIEGNPWFVAADVCSVLYSTFNRYAGVARYLQNVAQDERITVTRKTPGISLGLFDGHKSPSYVVLSESGLYKLVMRSDKPEARQFQDWVTRVVLPTIRKDGAYIQG